MYNSADLSEFTCSLCFQPFEDKPEKLPRLLPDCGHTFCSKCIINLLEKTLPNMPFLCPDDQYDLFNKTFDFNCIYVLPLYFLH